MVFFEWFLQAAAIKGKGKKGGGRDPKRAKIGPEKKDDASSQEEAPEAQALDSAWSTEKMNELKNWVHKEDGRVEDLQVKEGKDRTGLTILQDLLEVPQSVLEHFGVEKTVQGLLTRTRYPHTERLCERHYNLSKLFSRFMGVV